MNKHQVFDLVIPVAGVAMLFFGGWCGWKRRFTLLTFTVMAWVIFAVWICSK